MDFDTFQSILTEDLDRYYQMGRLTHKRGIIVSRSLYDEIVKNNTDFTGKITAEYERGTREVTFTFYVLVSDGLPWGYDFLITGQTEDHYRTYYLGNEDHLWNRPYVRSIYIPAIGFRIAEGNAIEGGIELSDNTYLEDVPFEIVLQVANEVAEQLIERGEDYRINRDFIALLKSPDWSSDRSASVYTLSDTKYYERELAYRTFCQAFEAALRERLSSEAMVLNEPHASWVDNPEMYSMDDARLESGVTNDVDAPSSALGHLLMEYHAIMDPPAFSIQGVYIDGFDNLHLFSVPLYLENGANVYYTQDPNQFLEIASKYFFPQEVREFLMRRGIKVSFRQLKALKDASRENWNTFPDLSIAGKITIIDTGSVGILSVQFTSTRGQLTDQFDIVYADTRNEWLRLRSLYFPARWKGYTKEVEPEEYLSTLEFV